MAATKQARGAEIPVEAGHLLEEKAFAHVATLMEDGSPQVSPVWIDREDDLVVFNTAAGRLKDQNLRRDPRVAISITDPENPYENLLIRGRVLEITERDADEHIDHLAKRYLDANEYPFRQPGEVRLKVRIRPERVSHTPA
ncbi:MAG TPA: PPOX class F420-dependent oxidoreductase [Solirubrobacterales bacterium]|nr:PPOX class F420-dependent oxidoreductase [Solirubrobacterales bacterium]